ncbi:hypothetical protein ACFE04_030264 [Oxalis oulophora]
MTCSSLSPLLLPITTTNQSQLLSSKPFLKQSFLHLTYKKPRHSPVLVYALQSNFIKVIQTVWNVGKDGIEAGTNLVPSSIPRPAARISVTVVAVAVSLFVLKSLLSTAFFVAATMGLAYFIFIALNKDEGPKGGGGGGGKTTYTPSSSDEALDEARRIMEKYKVAIGTLAPHSLLNA